MTDTPAGDPFSGAGRQCLEGRILSTGRAFGLAWKRFEPVRSSSETQLANEEIEPEIQRLQLALETTREQFRQLRRELREALEGEIGEILDLHALLLDDPELAAGLADLIRTGRVPAERALELQHAHLVAAFEAMEDPYLRSRREDVDHLMRRLQAALGEPLPNAPEADEGRILVAESVAAAELLQLRQKNVLAVLTSRGSTRSHSAILARSLGLPYLLLEAAELESIRNGTPLLVDALQGQLIIEPDARDLQPTSRQPESVAPDAAGPDSPLHSADGIRIRLQANAESMQDIHRAARAGADGIGLFRTEFLFLQNSAAASEEVQLAAYRQALEAMQGRPVTLRVLDLGADKIDAGGLALGREENPALGLRGIRLMLSRPEVFRCQLRAMLRASAFGPVRILLPMVGQPEQIEASRVLLQQCRQELESQGHAMAESVPLGVMLEVPVLALSLQHWIGQADFVSIGSNDLIQYLVAADRNSDRLDALSDPLQPGILRLLHEVFRICEEAGKPASLCGEIAGDPALTRLLLALGLRRFSVGTARLDTIRARIRTSRVDSLRAMSAELLASRQPAELLQALEQD